MTTALLPRLAGEVVSAASFTVYSAPFDLRFGEVYMSADYEQLPLPREVVARYAGSRRMAVTSWTPELVRRYADGGERRVPLTEVYNHHAKFRLVDDGVEQGIGTAADFRGARDVYEAPFRDVFDHPRHWSYYAHLINLHRPHAAIATSTEDPGDTGSTAATRRAAGVDPLSQCPCTPQRRFNITSGTIDGRAPDPPFVPCDGQMLAEANPTCTLATYRGGVRCCQSGMFVTDTSVLCASPDCAELPVERVWFKLTVGYEDFEPKLHTELLPVPVELSGSGPHSEFDVRPCEAGTPPTECTFTHTFVAPVFQPSGASGSHFLVHSMMPHLHSGALSITLQRAATNETLCAAAADAAEGGGLRYGNGTAVGDEAGFLVGVTFCTRGVHDAPTITVGEGMRVTAVYDSSTYLTGVMATWKLRLFTPL